VYPREGSKFPTSSKEFGGLKQNQALFFPVGYLSVATLPLDLCASSWADTAERLVPASLTNP